MVVVPENVRFVLELRRSALVGLSKSYKMLPPPENVVGTPMLREATLPDPPMLSVVPVPKVRVPAPLTAPTSEAEPGVE